MHTEASKAETAGNAQLPDEFYPLLTELLVVTRKVIRQDLLSCPIEDFAEKSKPYVVQSLREKDNTPESIRLLVEIINEVTRERDICDMCFSGIMKGSMDRRSYQSTFTCSHCGRQQDRS